ncbi:MAG: S8 family serine peptidase [Thermoanaerobaculia bacterium]|nr:S8 family serine peptidase [Thermoanaerobaculia bacterium]
MNAPHRRRHLWRIASATLLAAIVGNSHDAHASPTYVRIQKTPALSYAQLTRAESANLESLGVTILHDYGPFAIGLATEKADLVKAGSAVKAVIGPEPDAYRVDGGGIPIDIREPTRAVANAPADLVVDDDSGFAGLYLVKFYGPVIPSWLEPLKAAGVRIVQYVHKDAYIVATAGGTKALAPLVGGPLIHVGIFHPYFKLAPSLRAPSALGATSASPVHLVLDPDADLQSIRDQVRRADADALIQVDRARGTASAALLAAPDVWRGLARDPAVLAVEPAPRGGISDERVNQIIAVRRNPDGTPTQPQSYKDWLSGLCLRGGTSLCGDLSSQIVDVMDSGLAAPDDGLGAYHPDLPQSRIASFRTYFGMPHLNDRYFHGTLVTGLLAGDPTPPSGTGQTDAQQFYYDMGVAPTVRIHPSRFINGIGQFGGALTTARLDEIVSNAYTDGARFQNSSWYEDQSAYGYTSLAREYDRLVRSARLNATPDEQITVVVAAGNNFTGDATRTVYSPATAKNVIAVGATALHRGPAYGGTLGGSCDTNHGIRDIAEFSRQGYQWDFNRFKPDIYAPGQNVTAARSQAMTGSSVCGGTPSLFLPAPSGLNYPANGTSFSAPIVTGAAVLARQKIFADTADPNCGEPNKPPCPNPSPALIKAALLSTTETNTGGYNYYRNSPITLWEPNRYGGFGRVALTSLLEDPVSKAYIDEDHAVTPVDRFTGAGGYKNYTFTVADPSKAISAVLVYHDAPAAVNASVVRVNEIDMYVMQGNGVYCDGQYVGQYATRSSGCWLPDMSNNVKRARIAPNSFTGQFTIQVVGSNVSANAVPGRDSGNPNQDWALYVYNAIRN